MLKVRHTQVIFIKTDAVSDKTVLKLNTDTQDEKRCKASVLDYSYSIYFFFYMLDLVYRMKGINISDKHVCNLDL